MDLEAGHAPNSTSGVCDIADELRAAERRCRRASLRFPDRRTGFDRRLPNDPVRTLRDQPAILFGLLAALNLLSIVDWVLTSHELTFGAREANLFIQTLLNASPWLVIAFKVVWMLCLSGLIWKARRYRLVLLTAVGAVGAYAVLMLYHVAGIVSIGAL